MDQKPAPASTPSLTKHLGLGASGGLILGLFFGLVTGHLALGICLGLVLGGGAGTAAACKKPKD